MSESITRDDNQQKPRESQMQYTEEIKGLEAAERLLSVLIRTMKEDALPIIANALDQMRPEREQERILEANQTNMTPKPQNRPTLHIVSARQSNGTIPILNVSKPCCVNENAPRFCNPRMVFDLCIGMARLDREHFVTLHLDGKNRIIARETVSIGSLNQSIVHPREVFKAALLNNSAAVILVHNHPTGDPTPSPEDRGITQRLREAGGIIGIKVLDHIIIGDHLYHSFVEEESTAVAAQRLQRAQIRSKGKQHGHN